MREGWSTEGGKRTGDWRGGVVLDRKENNFSQFKTKKDRLSEEIDRNRNKGDAGGEKKDRRQRVKYSVPQLWR